MSTHILDRHPPQNKSDYMKYQRIIRYFTIKRYKITSVELDILLFMRSEFYMTEKEFNSYMFIMPWKKGILKQMVSDGWIDRFEIHQRYGKYRYNISIKGKRMVDTFYRRLEGDMPIPRGKDANPLLRQKLSYTDKRYRDFIKKMHLYARSIDKSSKRPRSSLLRELE